MQTEANGVTLNYQIDGPEGAPWVTFSTSIAADLTMWDDQAVALRNRYRILRYDIRGHGNSASTPPPYGFETLVGDVVGLWDALGIQRSHFVGLSIGGMCAMGLGIGHGGRLLSITAASAKTVATPKFREMWDGRIEAARSGGMEAVVQSTVDRWFTPGFVASGTPVLDKVRNMVRGCSVEGYEGAARALQQLDYLSRLGEITVPTLFIAGREDTSTPPELVREAHEMVAGSRYVELTPAAHISNMEQPEAFTAAVAEFLDSLTG